MFQNPFNFTHAFPVSTISIAFRCLSSVLPTRCTVLTPFVTLSMVSDSYPFRIHLPMCTNVYMGTLYCYYLTK